MLPITEFQFAFCGIATFAATFGYACARRASSRPLPGTLDVAPEEKTLKRKLDESDAESEDEQERPVKRSRTPPVDHEEEEWEVIISPPCEEAQNAAPHPEPTSGQRLSTAAPNGTMQAEEGAESTDEPTPENTPTEGVQPVQAEEVQSQPNEPESQPLSLTPNEPEPRSVTPPPSAIPQPVTHRPNAFSAFTNTQSPFAKYSNTPFPSSTSTSTPAWRCGKSHAPDAPADSAGAPSPNNITLLQSPNEIAEASSVSALADRSRSPASIVPKTSSHVTGEEDESVSAELRGVKLFVKRGRKEFTDGNFGHIKILTHNERTRLLFRRDPLGQVSMNVALQPAVRCHYDAGENILRVVLMEQVAVDGKEAKDEVAIYALKPGRSSKADFKVFAEALCANDRFKVAS